MDAPAAVAEAVAAPKPLAGFTDMYQGLSGRLASAVDGHGVVVAMVCLALVIFVVIAYVVYRFLITSLKTATLLDRPAHAREGARTVDAGKIPTLDNGLEYALSLWLYVDVLLPDKLFKQVLLMGTADACSVYCAMDRQSNALYFALRLASATSSKLSDAQAAIDGVINGGAKPTAHNFAVFRVEYVPLQRWVNLVMVLNQDIVTLYLDGDIYSVTSVQGATGAPAPASSPAGALTIGDPTSGVQGFVSRVQFFNYATSVYHARMLYSSGPVNRGYLGFIGLPRYKLQWPVTSIDDGKTV